MKRPLKYLLYLSLILLAVICFMPFYLMIVNATRSNGEILSQFRFIPGTYLLQNFRDMSEIYNVFGAFWNSVFVTVSATVLTCYVSALTAFAFAVYRFRGRNLLFALVLITMMIPSQLGILGLYELSAALRILNTYTPLIIPAAAAAPAVFFIKQYGEIALPPSLIEAARVEGAKELKIFHAIGLPILAPAIATMAIFQFVANWNNYLYPLILLFDPEKYTLPVLIASMSSSVYDPNLGVLYLAIAVSTMPIMIVFFFCSKFVIAGLTAGAVKE